MKRSIAAAVAALATALLGATAAVQAQGRFTVSADGQEVTEDDGTVVQIDAQDGQVTGVVPVGHAPTDVASLDGTVWVSIQSESAM